MRALQLILFSLLTFLPSMARANQEHRKPASFPEMPLELNGRSGMSYDPYGWSRKNNLAYVMGMQGESFTAGVRYGYAFVPGNEISVAVLPNSAGVAGNMMYQLKKRAGGLFVGAASGIQYGSHVQEKGVSFVSTDAQWGFKNALFAVGEISLGYRTSEGWQVRLFAGAGRLVNGDLECLESCQGNSQKSAPETDKNMGFFGIELGHVF